MGGIFYFYLSITDEKIGLLIIFTGSLYYGLVLLLNYQYIIVTENIIMITQRPLPWFHKKQLLISDFKTIIPTGEYLVIGGKVILINTIVLSKNNKPIQFLSWVEKTSAEIVKSKIKEYIVDAK